jgi:hypothetical protein
MQAPILPLALLEEFGYFNKMLSRMNLYKGWSIDEKKFALGYGIDHGFADIRRYGANRRAARE